MLICFPKPLTYCRLAAPPKRFIRPGEVRTITGDSSDRCQEEIKNAFQANSKFLHPGRVFQRRSIWPANPTRHRGTGEGNNDRTGATAVSVSTEKLVLKDGSDVKLKFAEAVSSKTATEGDSVNLVLDEDLKVGNVVVAKAGSKAVGTVTHAKKPA